MTKFTFDTKEGYYDIIAGNKDEAITIFKITYPNVKINKRKIYEMAEPSHRSIKEIEHMDYVGNIWEKRNLKLD